MIPYNQLRIGNCVLANEKLQQISSIDQERAAAAPTVNNTGHATVEYTLATLLPVPLSQEILKQCGFVFHAYFKFWQLIEGTGTDRSEMDIDEDFNILDFMRRPVVKKVASLHQLQNIYFVLKGRELNFRAG